ncbi:FAD synthetase family protein [Bacillus massiliigorillae]|uniref:FAD synthetase family protein n=1 Tax=Bacillus massiliigorillae TaxID=1243664 RepID=UPI0003A3C872|nr:FAD synthetase family protein [Bacillus massiliigorillae]
MKIIYVDQENIPALQLNPVFSTMALGYFDGVHLGHRKVIDAAKDIAKQNQLALSVLSFFPHPKSVLYPSKEMQYLEPLEERIEKLEKIGVDIFYVVQFDKAFAQIEPDVFIRQYILGLGAKQIVCGFDYHYGAKARGNVDTLKQYENERVGVTIIEEQCISQQKISSSIIREYLNIGKVDEIPKYLGDYYKIKWCCQKGLFPYYSMSAPGKYRVLVDNQNNVIESKVIVTHDRQLEFDYCLSKLGEQYTVSWLEHVNH